MEQWIGLGVIRKSTKVDNIEKKTNKEQNIPSKNLAVEFQAGWVGITERIVLIAAITSRKTDIF
jgi:hypothetical protein